MSRIPAMTREKLSVEDQATWDRVMKGRTGGGGPYGILIYAPKMAEHFSAAENYFRHEGMLDTKDKELMILATARELGARFPWSRHEIRAREVGVRPEAVEALRTNGSLDALDPRERLMVEFARSLLRERRLPDDLLSRALAELGPERLVEAVGLVSHYNMISCVANVFGLDAPEGAKTF
ncbi:MAG TPA: carboxymuconolactone decarboxylase family protein [Candidatus Acidoferrales bacterium]|nr:carboxymuconolactone decarboxylase family protein [Candidatus Acidoferrales bacterium]